MGVKMTPEQLLNSFTPPPKKKTFIPPNKFLVTPLCCKSGAAKGIASRKTQKRGEDKPS